MVLNLLPRPLPFSRAAVLHKAKEWEMYIPCGKKLSLCYMFFLPEKDSDVPLLREFDASHWEENVPKKTTGAG